MMCVKRVLIAVIDDDEPFRLALVDSLCSLEYRRAGLHPRKSFLLQTGKARATASSLTFICPE